MRLTTRLGLFAAISLSTLLSGSAEAQLFPIFKCRKKCCCEAPEPEPVCCPVAEEPEPCPEPEPAPVCCPEPEPAPEPDPVCCPAPVCETAEPAPEPSAPVCCSETAGTEVTTTVSPTDTAVSEYGMPELAEGETLVSISPIEVPTDDAATTTSTSSE